MDLDVVDWKGRKDVDRKGWNDVDQKGRQLDPDVVDGMVGRDVNWIPTLLLEWLEGISLIGRIGKTLNSVCCQLEERQLEGLDPYVVDCRDVNWKGWIRTSNWKGHWIRALLLEGLDPDIVAGRGVIVDCSDWRCCWLFRSMLLLLIVPIDVVVALISLDIVVAIAGWTTLLLLLLHWQSIQK